MGLRFRGAGADRRPGDELRQILRHDRIERLGAGRQAELGHVQEKLAREQYPLLDVKRIVEVRIVDQSLPAHRGARLLEIHPHDQHQRGADLIGQALQAIGVLPRRIHVVNRARPHHHEQPRIAALQDRADDLARTEHRVRRPLRQRKPALHLFGGRQQVARGDIDVLQSVLDIRHVGPTSMFEWSRAPERT